MADLLWREGIEALCGGAFGIDLSFFLFFFTCEGHRRRGFSTRTWRQGDMGILYVDEGRRGAAVFVFFFVFFLRSSRLCCAFFFPIHVLLFGSCS